MAVTPSRRPSPLSVAAWALGLLGLFLLVNGTGGGQVQGEEATYYNENLLLGGINEWSGANIINGNLTISSGGWLIIEAGDLIFNTTYPGQFGLTIQPGGGLDIINGTLRGNHPFHLNNQGELWGIEAELAEVWDDDSPHVSQGGLLWWDGGWLAPSDLRFTDSRLVLANFSQEEEAPSIGLDNSTVKFYNASYNLSQLNWLNGPPQLERGYILDLTFHGKIIDKDGQLISEPITDGTLNISRNGTLIWQATTNETGAIWPVGLSTERYDASANWTSLETFRLNFSRGPLWWANWTLELNESVEELLHIYSDIGIEDIEIISSGSPHKIIQGDVVTFKIRISNKGNVWVGGQFTARLLERATSSAWFDNTSLTLAPNSEQTVTFDWEETIAGNYALYLIFTYTNQTQSQRSVDVEKPTIVPPTFLGLGYEYWLVILPVFVLLGGGSAMVIREQHRLGNYRVEEVFLLDSVGRVISHSATAEGGLDEDLVGSMLTALQDFVAESFHAAGGGEGTLGTESTDEGAAEQKLKQLEHGDLMLLIEHGYHCFIVLVISGQDRPEIRRFMQDSLKDIEARFGPVLADWDGDAARLKGADEIVEQLAQVKSAVHWRLDPRALIAGWRQRHGR